MSLPALQDVREAARRIAPHAHHTPVLRSKTLDRLSGATLLFKAENLQRVGAFKFRGACNAVFSLSDDEARAGVLTHSSGNHAQALALAARLRGIRAHIVMPEGAPEVKRAAVEGYGAEISICAATLEAREAAAAELRARTGALFIHPYDDARIIAGQGTAALELLEECGSLDAVIAPVGGGGLLSGTGVTVRGLAPETAVLGAEPAGADDAYRSLREGRALPSVAPQTIADGLLTSLGELTFPLIQRHVEEILLVEEEAIARAMRLVWERMKILIEPSAAVPVAALLENTARFRGQRVGVILSGGNVDLDALPWAISSGTPTRTGQAGGGR